MSPNIRLFVLSIPLALLVALGMSQSPACNQATQVAADGVVAAFNCEASGSIDPAALADAESFAADKIRAWITGSDPADLAALKAKILADLTPVKSNLGRCAIAGALAAIATLSAPTPGVATAALTAGPNPAAVRAMFSSAARERGWAPLKVGGSVL